MNVGNKIKELRIKKNFSQVQLAEAIGSAQALITAYENNKRIPRLDTLQRIAAALDVSMLALLPSEITAGSVKLSPEDEKLLALVEELNPEGKKKVQEYAEDLTKIPAYRSDR